MTKRPTYQLTIRPEPNTPAAEDIRRLRSLLKRLLRDHGLRCVRIEPVKTDPEATT